MNVALAAARNGHLDCLKYVAEFGTSYGVAYFAAMNGHLSCLQFAVENDFPVHSGVIDMCAEKGHTEFIKYFYNNSYRQHIATSKQLLFSVVKGDHIELLQFLLECGVPLHVELPRIAATNGSVNCLRYVIEHGSIVPTNILSVAATSGNIETVQYLVSLGHEITRIVIDKAYAHNRTECLQYMHDYLLQTSIDANSTRTADMKVLACVKNAYKYGCSWNDSIMLQLETQKYDACIIFARSRGYVPKLPPVFDTVFDVPSV